jgi:hypothetical protein
MGVEEGLQWLIRVRGEAARDRREGLGKELGR